jgi:hypothetical protein
VPGTKVSSKAGPISCRNIFYILRRRSSLGLPLHVCTGTKFLYKNRTMGLMLRICI